MGKQLVRKSIAAGLQTIRAVRPLLVRIRGRDEALAQQLVRALNDVVLSLGRAEYPRPALRTHVLAAAGSAIEARALLQMTVDFHYCTWRSVKRACEGLDRTTTMLQELARRKPPSAAQSSRRRSDRPYASAVAPLRKTA